MPWQPWLGAVPGPHGTSFRVWAPRAPSMEVKISGGPASFMTADGEGYHTATVEGVRPGARYVYRFPDGRERPDPASPLQPDGVHGPSEVVDLDVVYNHFGPEGNYLGEFGPYFTSRHHTPWGDAVNYDGPDAGPVRRFVIENALRWVASAGGGFDGLRLDAVHGIVDDSPIHLLRELNDAVQREARETGRVIHVIAESDLNEARLVESPERGGYGLAAAWADDFHHALHVALTGESSGYYEDFAQ